MGLLHHPFWLQLVLALLVITFQLFYTKCLAKDHWRGFSTRNAHTVHIVNIIRSKNNVYILVEVSIWIWQSMKCWISLPFPKIILRDANNFDKSPNTISILRNIFAGNFIHIISKREKERDLTQSYDKNLYTHGKIKKQRDNSKTQPKFSITQRLRTNLGRSVWVTVATQMMWWKRLMGKKEPNNVFSKLNTF